MNFSLPDKDGKIHSLKDFLGKWVVLYFYPKDNTSGCTLEAIDFTASKDEFEKRECTIIGVSKDSQKSHCRFIEKHDLSILLLSDESHEIAEAFGAWGKKKMYGKEYEGTIRSTFILDPSGNIVKEWRKVKVKGHVQNVLDSLIEIQEKSK